MKYLKSIIFCSPNLGIVHSWLNVFQKIPKNILLDAIYFPKASTLQVYNKNDPSYFFINKNVKKIYLKSYFNNFFFFKNINNAKIFLNQNNYKSYLLLKKILIFPWFGTLVFYFFKYFEYCLNFKNVTSTSRFIQESEIIFCDFWELKKDYYNDINSNLFSKKIFSLNHGSGIQIENKKFFSNYFNKFKFLNIFVWSNIEKKLYKKKLNSKINVVSIPKHKLKKKEIQNYNIKKQVILFSRNYDYTYFPLEEKLKFLKMIKENVIDKNEFYLFIKRHPDEETEINHKDIFYTIFKKKNMYKNWEFIEDPKFKKNNYYFGITFISSTCLDLIVNRIPVIELLNVKKNMFYPNLKRREKYLTKYSFFNFVKNLNSVNEFKMFIKKLKSERNQIAKKQLKNYLKIYKKPDRNDFKILKIIKNNTN